jgi:hypothetical protein
MFLFFLIFMSLLFAFYVFAVCFRPKSQSTSLPLLHILSNDGEPYNSEYFLKRYRNFIKKHEHIEMLNRIEDER